MFNHTISAILRGSWLIEKGFADAHLPVVMNLLQGKLTGNEFLSGSGDYEFPFYIAADKTKYKMDLPTSPGSIAVIPFVGPMTKYNGGCGEPGMVKRQGWLSNFDRDPNIVGIISLFDTPGGTSDGTPQLASYIKNMSKPTVAVVLGMACSAGAWLASAHDHIYASDEYAEFGSIGAYINVVDYRGQLEKDGIKVQQVYPDISRDKNIGYRKALDGDLTMVTQEVHNLASLFISSIKNNRQGKLTSEDWTTGKVFGASKASELGLIDGIKSMDDIISGLLSGSLISFKSSANNQQSNMKFTNVTALAGVENATEEQLDQANADLTAAGITHFTLVPESMITDAENVSREKDQLSEQLESANTARTNAENSLATANTKIQDLEAEVERLNKTAGDSHSNSIGSDDPAETSQDGDIEAILSAMPHNRTADRLFG